MAKVNMVREQVAEEEILSSLSQPVREWFTDRFPQLTEPQRLAIPVIQNGGHLLLCSPTGSGKTLTAFLTIIDQLVRKALDGKLEKRIYCVYISPIKALANDIQRNLIEPLREIKERFLPSRAQDIVVGLRTGDTTQTERQRMLRNPPHILITTPESLALTLGSKRFRPLYSDLRWMVIDELHAMVPTKRGTHLSLNLANLDRVLESPVQRIGISATMEPLDEVARFLVQSDSEEESMEVSIAHVSGSRDLDLDIVLPTDRFNDTPVSRLVDHNVSVIKDLVEAHRTTLVFANTRRMTEILVQRLRVAGVAGVEGHHGSMDKSIRLDVEQRLKHGHLRCVVSSSSLELGIDIGSVDMVVQIGSPGSIATALQRIGRAGHHVGGVPRARLLPTSTHDLLEMVALQNAILAGIMDRLRFPRNCLDVLAQFLIGITLQKEWDIDDAFELVNSAWSYSDLAYDDFIEVLDMLAEDGRIWIEWEENIFGKRGYSQMIYYTNVGTIAPDSNYLVFTQDGTLVGQLSSSFVQNLRPGDVFLLGGQTYRVHAMQSTRVNVSPVTGHRPTVPSWSGEALSRSRELSESILDVLQTVATIVRRGGDPRLLFTEVYGLSKPVSNSLARFLEEHLDETFQVPSEERIIIEQTEGGMPTYIVTTCRGRAFNMALGHLFAGIAGKNEVAVLELSFDENGFLIKLNQDVDMGLLPRLVSEGGTDDILQRFLLDSQLFQRRFKEVCARSLLIPRRIGAEEVSPQQFQQKAEQLLKRHRQMDSSLMIREAQADIHHSDLDLDGLEDFIEKMRSGSIRIVHSRVRIPSPLGMNLFMSAFEDLLSMRARAFLVKDIDPEILRRLLGRRALQTELDEESLDAHYRDKVEVPQDADGLLRLMDVGGGLERDLQHPLYGLKLKDIEISTIRGWVRQLAEEGRITKIRGTGDSRVDDKWYSARMAGIHGTLGCLAAAGANQLPDLRELYRTGLTFEAASAFDGATPTEWESRGLNDAYECLRVKLLDMLGSEGPLTLDALLERLPFPSGQIEGLLHDLEVRNLIAVGFYRQTDAGEYILRVDEYRITGGEEDVVEARQVQNLLLEKSFEMHDDPLDAIRSLVMVSKQQELLYRVRDYRFGDWKDVKHDSDVVMGRLLHNRIGYTLRSQLPILMGLKPEPWKGELEDELLTRIPDDKNISRQELLSHYPKGKENEQLKRDLRNAINNLDRQMLVVKQYREEKNRKRSLSLYHKVHGIYSPLPFEEALARLVEHIGPIRLYTLRNYVSRAVEEVADTLRDLEASGRIVRIVTLQPDPVEYYASPIDAARIDDVRMEDRRMRILTQSDPYCSRFIQEIRYVLKQGWYQPVFKGVDPIGRILMYKVNDYLEIKDILIPNAYLEEFGLAFDELLENYADQLVSVAVLHNFNGEPIDTCPPEIKKLVDGLGFSPMGDGKRWIRGGVVEPQPRNIVLRGLLHSNHVHQNNRLENETQAIEVMAETRDDFALRGRCEVLRVDLDSLGAAHQLHQGTNLRGHIVWASYPHFRTLLTVRNMAPEDELLDVLEYFSENAEPAIFMERYAMRRAEFRKLVQPLIRSGHLVQDYRGGFRTVDPLDDVDVWEIKQKFVKDMIDSFPVVTRKQVEALVGRPFKPDEVSAVLQGMVEEGVMIKGFLIDDASEVCYGRKDLLEKAKSLPKTRDFVLPPSDPLLPYFAGMLRQRFGFGSAYIVFHKEEPIAAFKANTRDGMIDVTDFEGDAERERDALRVMKEFAWEHSMPLIGKIVERLRTRVAGR